MKHKTTLIALAVIACIAALLLSNATSSAKLADTYTIDWYSIDAGGTTNLQGGVYTLNGTVGQFDVRTLSGGTYQLNGGFWGFLDSLAKLFLPLIVR